MPQTTNQTQQINLSQQLQSLSTAVHSLLQSENINPQSITFYEANLKDFALNLVSFGLLPSERVTEIEQVSDPQDRLAKLLEILDEFLESPEEDLINALVPQGILKGLVEESEKAAAQNEKLIQEIQEKNQARIEQIQRRSEIEKYLNKNTRQTVLEEPKVREIAAAVAEEVQPELAKLESQVQKAQDSEVLRAEIEKHWQEIYERSVRQLNVDEETQAFLLSRKLSVETLIELSTADNPAKTREVVEKTLTPLLPRKAEFVQKEILPELAINAANITETQDIQAVAAIAVGEKLQELQAAGFSQDEIVNLIFDLSRETQSFIQQFPRSSISFGTAPTVTLSEGKVHVSLTSPQPSGNPQGKVIDILVDDKHTIGQTVINTVLRKKLDSETNASVKKTIFDLKQFKVTIDGYTHKFFERAERRASTKTSKTKTEKDLNLNQVAELKKFASSLRVFQKPFTNLPALRANRLKALREVISKVPSPKKIIYQKVGAWVAKTSIGKAFKAISTQVAQKGLQVMWTGIKKGATKVVTKATVWVLTKLGFQAIAQTVATATLPIIGNVIAFVAGIVIEKVIKAGYKTFKNVKDFIPNTLTKINSLLGSLFGIQEGKELKHQNALMVAAIIIAVVFLGPGIFTSAPDTFFVDGGRGEGPWTNPNIPLFPEEFRCPEATLLAEKVACVLQKCNTQVVHISSFVNVSACINSADTSDISTSQKSTILKGFHASLFVADGYLQCVGFVTAVQDALGQSIGQRHACQYGHGPEPSGFRRVNGQGYEPASGDIAIWDGTVCGMSADKTHYNYGHIAIVLEPIDKINRFMRIAHANFTERGKVDVVTLVPYGDPNHDISSSPNYYLVRK